MSSDYRQWVQEHKYGVWHWYGSGHYAHAACGNKPIAGTPCVSEAMPGELVCATCKRLYEARPVKPDPKPEPTPAPDFADWDLPRLAFEYRNCHFTQTAELNALAKEIQRREKPVETKPGLPTEPGAYRLQFKGGHEIILELKDGVWYCLSGLKVVTPCDVVCHLKIEPLQAPATPGLVELLARESYNSDHEQSTRALFRQAADALKAVTKKRDAARAELAAVQERCLRQIFGKEGAT